MAPVRPLCGVRNSRRPGGCAGVAPHASSLSIMPLFPHAVLKVWTSSGLVRLGDFNVHDGTTDPIHCPTGLQCIWWHPGTCATALGSGGIGAVSWSPDGASISSGGEDGTILVGDLLIYLPLCSRITAMPSHRTHSIDWSIDHMCTFNLHRSGLPLTSFCRSMTRLGSTFSMPAISPCVCVACLNGCIVPRPMWVQVCATEI